MSSFRVLLACVLLACVWTGTNARLKEVKNTQKILSVLKAKNKAMIATSTECCTRLFAHCGNDEQLTFGQQYRVTRRGLQAFVQKVSSECHITCTAAGAPDHYTVMTNTDDVYFALKKCVKNIGGVSILDQATARLLKTRATAIRYVANGVCRTHYTMSADALCTLTVPVQDPCTAQAVRNAYRVYIQNAIGAGTDISIHPTNGGAFDYDDIEGRVYNNDKARLGECLAAQLQARLDLRTGTMQDDCLAILNSDCPVPVAACVAA